MKITELVVNLVGESLVITPANLMQQAFFNGIALLPDDYLIENLSFENWREPGDLKA